MAGTTHDIIDRTFDLLVRTYEPQPVVMDYGCGIYIHDTEGKRYIDCAAGIAVASLGHAHPAVLNALQTQGRRLMAVQNSYATPERLQAAELIVSTSCIDRVYFCNSGTESVEAALKCARKWASETKGTTCNEIITFRNSFHGRTYGSASVTEKCHAQPFFGPYLPGIKWATFNNLESVTALISDKTAAILVEPVQGEGGLTVAEPAFLHGLRALCDTHDICLIFDEVQSGFGRLGFLHAHQAFPDEDGVIPEPDIIAWAKGMGGGFPVGAMGAREWFGQALAPGTHGSTYGGNPLACAVAHAVISEIQKPGFLEQVRDVGKILQNGLHRLQRKSALISDVRGKGLMIGIETSMEVKSLIHALRSNGLMTTQAGKNTVRITPPLTMTNDQAQDVLEIIEKTLGDLQ
ncbi:aspartate aminotransferase family protein [Haematospirillum sp. H1815]|uniref:aspartate aminotransferase family protein n=1 Tax=Haematospirillum sp. H1815 TaxID=2723108 RepID=UPI00143B0FB0|nr:aspartate aminotransferase family protein [Haematospirillum sp. H1815]NKD77496.1 aspartate aminotransferase family protein [Haematospirillum sp. H1815]